MVPRSAFNPVWYVFRGNDNPDRLFLSFPPVQEERSRDRHLFYSLKKVHALLNFPLKFDIRPNKELEVVSAC